LPGRAAFGPEAAPLKEIRGDVTGLGLASHVAAAFFWVAVDEDGSRLNAENDEASGSGTARLNRDQACGPATARRGGTGGVLIVAGSQGDAGRDEAKRDRQDPTDHDRQNLLYGKRQKLARKIGGPDRPQESHE
jgi:hypothetical protein